MPIIKVCDECHAKAGTYGNKVVMHTSGEAEHYNGKIWTCKGDEFFSLSGGKVVFLEGFKGFFSVYYLEYISFTHTERGDKNIIDQEELEMVESVIKSISERNF